jgi:hypothetical protein
MEIYTGYPVLDTIFSEDIETSTVTNGFVNGHFKSVFYQGFISLILPTKNIT